MIKIHCTKLNIDAEALTHCPYPGSLGEKILSSISKPAWNMWLDHQTMLINEYRLNLLEPEARKFLETEMQKFLFEDNSEKPEGYTPE
mgnify:CR=1 FL=1